MILTDSIILFFLILLSAFFSGSETAFMNLKVHRKSIPAHLKAILKDEQLFLTSVLSANTVVNISIAVISTYLTSYIFANCIDFLIAIFLGTISPKTKMIIPTKNTSKIHK